MVSSIVSAQNTILQQPEIYLGQSPGGKHPGAITGAITWLFLYFIERLKSSKHLIWEGFEFFLMLGRGARSPNLGNNTVMFSQGWNAAGCAASHHSIRNGSEPFSMLGRITKKNVTKLHDTMTLMWHHCPRQQAYVWCLWHHRFSCL